MVELLVRAVVVLVWLGDGKLFGSFLGLAAGARTCAGIRVLERQPCRERAAQRSAGPTAQTDFTRRGCVQRLVYLFARWHHGQSKHGLGQHDYGLAASVEACAECLTRLSPQNKEILISRISQAASMVAPKKDKKIFHPDSRKAAQLTRTHLRKSKLAEATAKRSKKYAAQGPFSSFSIVLWTRALKRRDVGSDVGLLVDVYGFFYHALPPVGVLTLEELHAVLRDVWLTRHDDELEQERVARRKGRPKSTKEAKLEEIKLRETEEYRTGIGASKTSPSPIAHHLDPASVSDIFPQKRSQISHMNLLSNSFVNGTKKKLPTSSCFDSSAYLALIPQWSSYPNLENTTRCE